MTATDPMSHHKWPIMCWFNSDCEIGLSAYHHFLFWYNQHTHLSSLSASSLSSCASTGDLRHLLDLVCPEKYKVSIRFYFQRLKIWVIK